MPELQRTFVATLRGVLPDGYTLQEEIAPGWLVRPGRAECGSRWDVIGQVYGDLTGLALPDVMPPRERRRLDAVVTDSDGVNRAIEIDETQHFSAARALTLTRYATGDIPVAFDPGRWAARCRELAGREARSGGWAAPRPPLFPGPGGRHRQRAFRDLLADVLPPLHGWLPTMRVSDTEAREAVSAPDPGAAVRSLVQAKIAGE